MVTKSAKRVASFLGTSALTRPLFALGAASVLLGAGQAQALDANDRPIPGLYAAGNDMQSVMGGQYPAPGITLGPALTFGWIAGRHAARQATSQEQPTLLEAA